jgi:hypothetical protein
MPCSMIAMQMHCVTPECYSLHSSKQQIDVMLKMHVARIYFKVFQLFQRYVASVVYQCCKSRSGCCNIAIAIHVCFKCIFQIFYLFQTYVTSVLYGCCIYMHVESVSYMLQLFHLSSFICYCCCIWMFQK